MNTGIFLEKLNWKPLKSSRSRKLATTPCLCKHNNDVSLFSGFKEFSSLGPLVLDMHLEIVLSFSRP